MADLPDTVTLWRCPACGDVDYESEPCLGRIGAGSHLATARDQFVPASERVRADQAEAALVAAQRLERERRDAALAASAENLIAQIKEVEAELDAERVLAARYREALEPFLAAAEKWEQTNKVPWTDEGSDPMFGRPPKWFAEIEVCNRDVLRARAVLADQGENDG